MKYYTESMLQEGLQLDGITALINGRRMHVHFDYESTVLTAGDTDVESRVPVVTASERDAKTSSVTKGVLVTLSNGLSFTVRRLEPSGDGLVRLILGN